MDTLSPPPPATRLVLNVGCGQANPERLFRWFRGPDWHEVRVDIDPAVKPDILAELPDLSMIPSQAVDAVWSSHNVEHLYPHQVPQAFAEFRRVVKPSGLVLVTVPDLTEIARLILDDRLDKVLYHSPVGPICPIDMLFGHRASVAAGNRHMAHRTGFTTRTLAEGLIEAGFARVDVWTESRAVWALAYPTRPPA